MSEEQSNEQTATADTGTANVSADVQGEGTSIPNPATHAPTESAPPSASIYDAIANANTGSIEKAPEQADPVAAQSERPDYLQEKYKTVEEQAKAYPELLKKYGEFKGAPEAYDLAKLPEHLNRESPLITKMAERFKAMNLSQEGFEAVVKDFVSIQEEFAEVKPQQIMDELGPMGKDIIGRVGNWIKNFSPEEQETFKNWSMSGKDIQLLDKLRASTPLSRAPTQADLAGHYGFETMKAVEAEKSLNWDRYKNDPAYASEISRRYQDAAMREGRSQESFAEMKARR